MQNRPAWRPRRIAMAAVLVLAALATLWFARSTYRSLQLLHSAQAAGLPQVSTVRGWMTLDYVAKTYGANGDALISGLGLPPTTRRSESIRDIAQRQNVSPFEFVQKVQRVLASLVPGRPRDNATETKAHDGFLDWVLSSLQVHGYPVLAAVMLLGAIGLPLPAGLSAALAGSLIATGHLWTVAVLAIALAASVLGDAICYGLGRWLEGGLLLRHGRWIGYTKRRHERAQLLFERLGGATILLTRTLVSSLSSLVSLFAGASRYSFGRFLAVTTLGRALWTSAYVGLGYTIAGDIEPAAVFLRQLTGLLISGGVTAVVAIYVLNPQLFAALQTPDKPSPTSEAEPRDRP